MIRTILGINPSFRFGELKRKGNQIKNFSKET
jgi:hypothetical protein